MTLLILLINFYLIEALLAEANAYDNQNQLEFRHSHQRFREDIEKYEKYLTERISIVFRDYLVEAVFDEICFGQLESNLTFQADRNGKSVTIGETWINEYNPGELCRTGEMIFRKGTWNEYYGGRAWEIAAQAYKIPDSIMFIDRLVDLEHNTGNLLGKPSGFLDGIMYLEEILKTFLDTKRYEDANGIYEKFGIFVWSETEVFVRRFSNLYQKMGKFSLAYLPVHITWLVRKTPDDDKSDAIYLLKRGYSQKEKIKDRLDKYKKIRFLNSTVLKYGIR